MFNQKFDLIISIGADCACTSYLRRFNLQNSTYPFDWIVLAPFQTMLDMIGNHFENFINIEDFEKLPLAAATSHSSYVNKRTKYAFYHDFSSTQSLEECFPEVHARYERRINRMYEEIDKASSLLFVWRSRDKQLDEDTLKGAHATLSSQFPSKDIKLLIIEHKEVEDELMTHISEGILKIEYDIASYLHHPKYNETMGHKANNDRIFSMIKMNISPAMRAKLAFANLLFFFAKLAPSKGMRRSLKRHINHVFLHRKL